MKEVAHRSAMYVEYMPCAGGKRRVHTSEQLQREKTCGGAVFASQPQYTRGDRNGMNRCVVKTNHQIALDCIDQVGCCDNTKLRTSVAGW